MISTGLNKFVCRICDTDASPTAIFLGGHRIFACPRCAVRFAPGAFGSPVDYDRIYNTAEYQSNQVSGLHSLSGEQLVRHPTYRSFFEHVQPLAGTQLLDVGCGVGLFGHGAHARGWNVRGIDVSEHAIQMGRSFAPFPMEACSIETVIDRGERYDVVTAFEVLEHLERPVAFLSAVKKVLRPQGQFFCTVPNWNCDVVQSATRPDWLPPVHLHFFTLEALEELGRRAGMGDVRTGVIWSDPLPDEFAARLRWLGRRVLRSPRTPLGLWMHTRLDG
jgi:SAM-dependent methyltransferase